MGMEYQQRWCETDQRLVRAERPKPNHILHLILSILTAGLWLIVWFLVAVEKGNRPWQCPICGGTTVPVDRYERAKAEAEKPKTKPVTGWGHNWRKSI